MSSALDALMGGGGGGAPPATIPDPQPHLAPDGGGGPDLSALLGGGGGGPDAGGGQQGAGEVDVLKGLVEDLKGYMDIPSVDESERLEATKALTILQKLLASNEKMSDSMAGTSPALRKALAPGGPA